MFEAMMLFENQRCCSGKNQFVLKLWRGSQAFLHNNQFDLIRRLKGM